MTPDLTAAEIVQRAGITYRQLDHWVTQGYLRPRRRAHNPGSGTPRAFTEHEATVADVMAQLVDLGVTPAAAARLGRRLALKGAINTCALRIELTA